MTYAAAVLAVACFAMALDRFRVFPIARRAIQAASDASRMMRDKSVEDDEKERSVRAASFVLFQSFGSITLRSVAALAVSFLPVILLQIADVVHLSAVNRLLMSWSGLLLASGTVVVVQFAKSRR